MEVLRHPHPGLAAQTWGCQPGRKSESPWGRGPDLRVLIDWSAVWPEHLNNFKAPQGHSGPASSWVVRGAAGARCILLPTAQRRPSEEGSEGAQSRTAGGLGRAGSRPPASPHCCPCSSSLFFRLSVPSPGSSPGRPCCSLNAPEALNTLRACAWTSAPAGTFCPPECVLCSGLSFGVTSRERPRPPVPVPAGHTHPVHSSKCSHDLEPPYLLTHLFLYWLKCFCPGRKSWSVPRQVPRAQHGLQGFSKCISEVRLSDEETDPLFPCGRWGVLSADPRPPPRPPPPPGLPHPASGCDYESLPPTRRPTNVDQLCRGRPPPSQPRSCTDVFG